MRKENSLCPGPITQDVGTLSPLYLSFLLCKVGPHQIAEGTGSIHYFLLSKCLEQQDRVTIPEEGRVYMRGMELCSGGVLAFLGYMTDKEGQMTEAWFQWLEAGQGSRT